MYMYNDEYNFDVPMNVEIMQQQRRAQHHAWY